MMLVDDQWCCAAVADVDVVADGDAFGGVGVVDVVDLDFDIVDAVAVVVDIYRFDFVNGNVVVIVAVVVVVAVVVDIDCGGDVVVVAIINRHPLTRFGAMVKCLRRKCWSTYAV